MDTFYLSSLTMLPFAPLSVVFNIYKWLKRNKETHTGDKYNPMRRSKDSLGKQNFFLLPLLPRWFFFSGSAHDIYIYVSATCRLSVNNKRTLQQNTLNSYMYNVTVTLFKVPDKTYESFKCHNITIAPSQSIDAPLFIVLHLDTGYRAQNPPA